MSRRRYVSTDISTDTQVNRLARTAGDFAAMLYTWLIPHTDDEGIIYGDEEEITLQVIPGRRDKSLKDVVDALEAMEKLSLIAWDREGRRILFPVKSFYKYQTYIREERRRDAVRASENSDDHRTAPHDSDEQRTPALNGAQPRISPQNTADQRISPQNTASLNPSHSPSHSHSHSEIPPVAIATSPKGGKRATTRIPDDFEITPELRAVAIDAGVPADQIAVETEKWRDHHAAKGDVVKDAAASWRTWMRNAPSFAANGRASPGGQYKTAAEKNDDRVMRLLGGKIGG